MRINLVDRKYPVGKWLRFQTMKGCEKLVGWKLVIYRWEIRLYK